MHKFYRVPQLPVITGDVVLQANDVPAASFRREDLQVNVKLLITGAPPEASTIVIFNRSGVSHTPI